MLEQIIKYSSLTCLFLGGLACLFGASDFNQKLMIIRSVLVLAALALIEFLYIHQSRNQKEAHRD